MLITDTHAHIYSEDEGRYLPVAKPLRPPPGSGSIEHLRREMAGCGVERVVAIQTSSFYGWDNRFLADSARDNAPWMVGVCTLNPDDSRSPELLRKLVEEHNVRGLRSVPAGGAEKHLDHPGVEALWHTAQELGIPANPLIRVELADELERMLRKFPELAVVLDHCMYPKGNEGLKGKTIQRVLRLARYPNLHAKLTWLVDSSAEDHPFRDTHPLLRAVVEAFGPERCVWGSDFPCELWTPKATYEQHFALFTQELGLTPAEKEAILSRTPGRLWFGES